MQIACVKWFELQYPDLKWLLHHSPNGGSRHIAEGAKFKKMGTRAGFSDLFLMVPARGFHGLFIEMKVPPNGMTETQKRHFREVKKQKYAAFECTSLDQFQNIVSQYLRNHQKK